MAYLLNSGTKKVIFCFKPCSGYYAVILGKRLYKSIAQALYKSATPQPTVVQTERMLSKGEGRYIFSSRKLA